MIRLISMEFIKYKRYHILWLGIASILFSILLAAFQLAGTNNSIISYTGLSEGVIWNHFSLFLPFTFTLIVGYSIMEALFSFLVTLLTAIILHCQDVSASGCAVSLKQMFVVSSCCYIAVLPIIIITVRKQDKFFSGVIFSFFYSFCGVFCAARKLVNLYPITIGLVLSDYAHEENIVYSPLLSTGVLFAVLLCSLILLKVCNRTYNDI